jgi:hypothetical protein
MEGKKLKCPVLTNKEPYCNHNYKRYGITCDSYYCSKCHQLIKNKAWKH